MQSDCSFQDSEAGSMLLQQVAFSWFPLGSVVSSHNMLASGLATLIYHCV